MTALVQAVMGLIDRHPNWVSLITFLTAMSEAVAVVGLFIPGTAILIGIGSLVGLGHLALWPIVASATLGAVVGDGVSYWMGHRYGDLISSMWPFRERPQLLARGQAFFTRHGTKSIVIGRFLPVLRAIVPLIAGMARMPPRRF
jgi:membrane protein DedA with SNARE-associated domain